MRRFALSLLLPLPFAALPLLALAFPATGGGAGIDEAQVATFTQDSTLRIQDEPLAQAPSTSYGVGCDDGLAGQS